MAREKKEKEVKEVESVVFQLNDVQKVYRTFIEATKALSDIDTFRLKTLEAKGLKMLVVELKDSVKMIGEELEKQHPSPF